MTVLLLWALVVAGQSEGGARADRDEPLRGRYATTEWAPLPCDLEIDDLDRYVLRCRGRATVKGPLLLWGGAGVSLLSGRAEPVPDDRWEFAAAAAHMPTARSGEKLPPATATAHLWAKWGDDREYRAAAAAYARQQFKEHGFYPLVVPPPRDDGRSAMPCFMVVAFDKHLFLVDSFERDDFCSAARGRKSKVERGRHLSFRSRGKKSVGIAWEEFCRADWRLSLQ